MFDSRLRLSNQVADESEVHLKDWFLTPSSIEILNSVKLLLMARVIAYDASSKGAENYLTLAQELISKGLNNGKTCNGQRAIGHSW